MGYLYFCPRIVYGFRDARNRWGDGKTMERDSAPAGIDVYAGEINKGYNICPIIGIECDVNGDGKLVYDPAEHARLMQFMEQCKTYYASLGIKQETIDNVMDPSHHSVISGDWECESVYTVPWEDADK